MRHQGKKMRHVYSFTWPLCAGLLVLWGPFCLPNSQEYEYVCRKGKDAQPKGVQPEEVMSGWTQLMRKSSVPLHWVTPRCGQQLAGCCLRKSFGTAASGGWVYTLLITSLLSESHLGTDCYFSFMWCSLLFKNKTNQRGLGWRLHLADSASRRN